MTNLFLTNENLKKTIQEAKISQDQKDILISKLPGLDEEERLRLLDVLKETFFLDSEKDETIKKIEENWK